MITVDEIDASLDEMTKLVTVYQHFVREDRKVALLMAGLPYRVSSLLSGKSTYKKRLLEAGVIEESEPGLFKFALPGFGGYLRERLATSPTV